MSNIKRVIEIYDAFKAAIDAAPDGDLWHECELWLGYRADLVATASYQAKRVSVIRSNSTLQNAGISCDTLNSNSSIVVECQVAELQSSGTSGMGTIDSRKNAYLALDALIDACVFIVRNTPAFAAITNPVVTIEHDTDSTAPIYKAWLVISEQSYQPQ